MTGSMPDALRSVFAGLPASLRRGALRSLDCQFGEHGAGKLLHGAAGPLALELAHGRGEFVQAEDAHRVIEQAQLGAARWM
jgi:hypothetical protein